MKREGTFCDLPAEDNRAQTLPKPCPFLSIGTCIGCNKDICHQHGSQTALSVSILRQATNTTSHTEMVRGAIAMCWKCVTALEMVKPALIENLVPALAQATTEGVATALASEAMKKSTAR